MVGILIVNLNNLELTKNCIDSLKKQINQEFRIYLFDQNSNEQGTFEYLNECENNNMFVYRNSENVPLNYIWNNFKYICGYEYLCFLNNDIVVSNTFVDDIIKIFINEPTVGVVIHVTNNNDYIKSKNNLEYAIFNNNNNVLYQGWDFAIRNSIIPDIPKQLTIFGGDDYIFAKISSQGYKVAMAFSSPIIHFKAKTRVKIINIGEIQRNDGIAYAELFRTENLTSLCATIHNGICSATPEPNMKLIQNKNCVFTAFIGDYDLPLSTTHTKLPDWDYICFTDNKEIKSDFWRVIYIENNHNNFLYNIKLGKYFKTNFYKYLLSYENLLWLDERITITNNINNYLNYLNYKDIVFLKHPDTLNILEEFERVINSKRESTKMVDIIRNRYAELGYDYSNGLISSGVILFKNNEKTIKFFKEWWNEIEHYSSSDQLSANFVLWKNPELNYVMLSGILNNQDFMRQPRTTQVFKHE